jgi:hypothetical protein
MTNLVIAPNYGVHPTNWVTMAAAQRALHTHILMMLSPS